MGNSPFPVSWRGVAGPYKPASTSRAWSCGEERPGRMPDGFVTVREAQGIHAWFPVLESGTGIHRVGEGRIHLRLGSGGDAGSPASRA